MIFKFMLSHTRVLPFPGVHPGGGLCLELAGIGFKMVHFL